MADLNLAEAQGRLDAATRPESEEEADAEETYRDKLVRQKCGLMDDLLTGRVQVSGGRERSGA